MKNFVSCDAWWKDLSFARKMHIHRYFYYIDDAAQDYMEDPGIDIRGSHAFMERDRGVRCGGQAEATTAELPQQALHETSPPPGPS